MRTHASEYTCTHTCTHTHTHARAHTHTHAHTLSSCREGSRKRATPGKASARRGSHYCPQIRPRRRRGWTPTRRAERGCSQGPASPELSTETMLAATAQAGVVDSISDRAGREGHFGCLATATPSGKPRRSIWPAPPEPSGPRDEARLRGGQSRSRGA
uniref:Uncharacterized protein n=1 Tax=Rousettus aegyptiacus TaxID=9407 RepID=A0A7J8C2S8_ROUAE|nr:hypothetical protein HJG63_009462 [Rousettus aegyptiacus]